MSTTDPDAELELLEELVERLGIEVRFEKLDQTGGGTSGGLCRLRSRSLVLVDRAAPRAEQIGVLLDVLAARDLDGVWIPPYVRRRLARRQGTR